MNCVCLDAVGSFLPRAWLFARALSLNPTDEFKGKEIRLTRTKHPKNRKKGRVSFMASDSHQNTGQLFAAMRFLGRLAVTTFEGIVIRRLRQRSKDLERELNLCIQREREWRKLEQQIQSALPRRCSQPNGDLTRLNTSRVILDAVGPVLLRKIVYSYLVLLETSAAIYERNGDYALGLFSSGWCSLLHEASRSHCRTKDDRSALANGKWHCHVSCWDEASRLTVETGRKVDVECRGGRRIYAVPIRTNGEIIGSINFGYGDPPTQAEKVQAIARLFGVRERDLLNKAQEYRSRPQLIISAAKRELELAAGLIGEIVMHRRSEEVLKSANGGRLKRQIGEKANSLREIKRRLREESVRRTQIEDQLKANEADLNHNREQLRAMATRLINAGEDERRQLARELHDDLGQSIAALILEADLSARRVPDYCRAEIRLLQKRMRTLADTVAQKAHQLHASTLEILGLSGAIDSLCADSSRLEGIPVKFTHRKVPDAIPGEVALNVFRIAQECLRNVSRHARARQVSVSLAAVKDGIRLLVKDNGIGFDIQAARRKPGLGLTSMSERARIINGTLFVRSNPGRGTQIDVRVPLACSEIHSTSTGLLRAECDDASVSGSTGG